MVNGHSRRIISLWFPRLASDRVLRRRPLDGPFVLTLKQQNANRIYCLNQAASQQGLHKGMSYADARAFCPDLQSEQADPVQDQRMLRLLCRWATGYCPWVGLEGDDGLVMDITGSAHLFGGERPMLDHLRSRLLRAGLSVQIGLADTRGGAWALAHYQEGSAAKGATQDALDDLPVAALRIDGQVSATLQRVGLRKIKDLRQAPRAPLNRRFGPAVLRRLDQALGTAPEEISPHIPPPHYAVRMTLPDPIGLVSDVMSGTERLLNQLCVKLKRQETGARCLCLTLRRVDQAQQQVELRLARPLRDPQRILPLFERGVTEIDAGFGIDMLRLEATQVDHLPEQQLSHVSHHGKDQLDDLISRLGTRVGLEKIQRFVPANSYIPERSYTMAPVAYSDPAHGWSNRRPRPVTLFPPEAIAARGPKPPRHFKWRRMSLTTGRATGPERIAPEWWCSDDNWWSGLRDYWHVETQQGRRLWLFYTPQNPGWFVQGEFI